MSHMEADVKVVRNGRWKQDRPSWCSFSAYGVYRLRKGECEPDYHYHDCDEYFFVIDGRAKLLLEDVVHEIGLGTRSASRRAAGIRSNGPWRISRFCGFMTS